jgi:hypothetical protein
MSDVERIPPEERRREGRRRNPTNWTYNNIPATMFSRGYTGHSLSRFSGKHLDQFYLINMNGRMYDPLLGIFLNNYHMHEYRITIYTHFRTFLKYIYAETENIFVKAECIFVRVEFISEKRKTSLSKLNTSLSE